VLYVVNGPWRIEFRFKIPCTVILWAQTKFRCVFVRQLWARVISVSLRIFVKVSEGINFLAYGVLERVLYTLLHVRFKVLTAASVKITYLQGRRAL
jgi:hypothetical protein